MSKASTRKQHRLQRAGSYSTRGSATGRNLLGWGENEVLTLGQERDAVIRRVEQIWDRIVVIKALQKIDTQNTELRDERRSLQVECKELNQRLTLLSAGRFKAKDNREFAQVITNVIRERVTAPAWASLVVEATKRLNDIRAVEDQWDIKRREREGLIRKIELHQKEILEMDHRASTQYITDYHRFAEARKLVGVEIQNLGLKLSALKDIPKRDPRRLPDLIADVMKERSTRPVWDDLVREAKDRVSVSPLSDNA